MRTLCVTIGNDLGVASTGHVEGSIGGVAHQRRNIRSDGRAEIRPEKRSGRGVGRTRFVRCVCGRKPLGVSSRSHRPPGPHSESASSAKSAALALGVAQIRARSAYLATILGTAIAPDVGPGKPPLAQRWQNSATMGTKLVDAAQVWTMLVKVDPHLADAGPNRSDVGRDCHKSGRNGLNSGTIGPNLLETQPNAADIGRIWHTFGRSSAQALSKSARSPTDEHHVNCA